MTSRLTACGYLSLSLSLIIIYMHICAWQSADSRVTTDHCRVTLQWLFTKSFLIARNVQKTLFDSRPSVAWPPTTVAWPFSDFFQNFPKLFETSKKRCLTVGRRSRDFRPLSSDRSVTSFKFFLKCLKRPKNVVWQSADGRVTPDHCRVTVQWLLSKFSQIVWKVQKNVVWQSADGRVTSDHCRVTVQRLFSKNFLIAWNVQKRRSTVGRRSLDLRPRSPDRSATFFNFFPNCLKRWKNLVWQSTDGRVTSDHCHVTSQRLPFHISPYLLKRRQNLFESQWRVVWPSGYFVSVVFANDLRIC